MKTKQLILVFGIFGIVTFASLAQSNSTNQGAINQFSRSKDGSPLIRTLVLQRQKALEQLILILDGDSPRESKLNAAKALGIYRATEGIDVLIRNLSLEMDIQTVAPDSLMKPEDVFPISKALEKIGNLAVPALIKTISETDEPKIARKCTLICLAIDGKEITELKFQTAAQSESAPQRKKKIYNAKTFFNTNVNFIK